MINEYRMTGSMAKVQEEKPKTFTEVLSIIEEFRGSGDEPLWYRGCGRSDHKLQPTLYRHRSVKKTSALANLERRLLTRFRQRGIPFHDRDLTNDWDALFFMQHYGVPTRLLDWTESPFVALYFALMHCPFELQKNGKPRFTTAASVWILKPIQWNRHALRNVSYAGGIIAPGDEALKGHRSTPDFSGMNISPVAVYGAYNSPRIVAQRGAFTIFGQSTSPMEKIFDDEDFPEDSLIKVTILPSVVPTMRESILNHGVTESVVFPDLTGLALEIKRFFDF
jgi:FRG domain